VKRIKHKIPEDMLINNEKPKDIIKREIKKIKGEFQRKLNLKM